MSNPEVNIGVVGATGLVGQKMLEILEERNFPTKDLRLFASANSAGREIEWHNRRLLVEDLAVADPIGLDVVLFSAGAEVSKIHAPRFAETGALVIDNSSAWRMDHEVPLVVSGVNNEALQYKPKRIIANPNCTTMIAVMVLKPLHDAYRLNKMIITSLQAASGAGQAGIDELDRQAAGLPLEMVWRDGREVEKPSIFQEPIERNVVPLRGSINGRDSDEERKLLHESRKILGIGNLAVSATCVSVPVMNGHSLSIEAQFQRPVSPEDAEMILKAAPGVSLRPIPTPKLASGIDNCLAGRIRQSGVFGKNGLSLFVAGDNLRKGAALNAVQIAELLIGKYAINPNST